MSSAIKALIVVVCFSVCGAGAFFATEPVPKAQSHPPNATPVKNRETAQRVWIQV
jgi:uncharacterized membrane protein YadS